MITSMVDITWLLGSWIGVPAWLPPHFPEACLTRQQKRISGSVYVGRPPGTYAFLPIIFKETVLQRLMEVGGGICVYNHNVYNTVHTFLTESLYQKAPLLLGFLCHLCLVVGLS